MWGMGVVEGVGFSAAAANGEGRHANRVSRKSRDHPGTI